MYHAIFVSPWPWWVAGPALGLVVVLTAWLGGKGLGVSTAYGSVCAAASRLPFFRQREFHEAWRVWFVAGLPLGGLAAAALGGWFAPSLAYGSFDQLTGGSLASRAGLLLAGGLLVGAGARWAASGSCAGAATAPRADSRSSSAPSPGRWARCGVASRSAPAGR